MPTDPRPEVTFEDRTDGDYRLVWVSGTGQRLTATHPADQCAGDHCCIHNPSDHHMRDWPTHLRGGGLMDLSIFTERICEHGIGHPDPDDPFAPDVHGCDGCCAPPIGNELPTNPDNTQGIADEPV